MAGRIMEMRQALRDGLEKEGKWMCIKERGVHCIGILRASLPYCCVWPTDNYSEIYTCESVVCAFDSSVCACVLYGTVVAKSWFPLDMHTWIPFFSSSTTAFSYCCLKHTLLNFVLYQNGWELCVVVIELL